MRKTVLLIVIATAAISTTANAQFGFGKFNVTEAQRAAGRTLFAEHCIACHGKSGVAAGYAPSLIGVFGRRAGSEPGFPFSAALKRSGIIWSDDNLMKWISKAPAMVPGTPMPHVSIADPAERLYIIEYVKTLSQPASKRPR